MKAHKYTEQELKLTAIIYASRQSIVDEVKASGKLPKKIPLGGFPTAMNHLVRIRGIELDLSQDEELVFEAILSEKRLAAGGLIIIPGGRVAYSLEQDQKVILCPPPRSIDWEL